MGTKNAFLRIWWRMLCFMTHCLFVFLVACLITRKELFYSNKDNALDAGNVLLFVEHFAAFLYNDVRRMFKLTRSRIRQLNIPRVA